MADLCTVVGVSGAFINIYKTIGAVGAMKQARQQWRRVDLVRESHTHLNMIYHQWRVHSHHCTSRYSCPLVDWSRYAHSHHCWYHIHLCQHKRCHLPEVHSLPGTSMCESLLHWCKVADTHHCWFHIHCYLNRVEIVGAEH